MDGAGARAFRSPALVRVLVGVACLLYAGLFGAAASHSQWLVYPLIPDEVVLSTFGGGQLEFALLDRLPAATLAAAAAVISQGIGFAGLTALRLQLELGRGERIGIAFAVGLSTMSAWTLAIGTLVGLSAEWLVLAPPTLVAIVGWWCEFRRLRRMSGAGMMASSWWRWSWLPFAAIVLLGAILPPWEFDVLEYHLQVPKEWHQAGRIGHLSHNVYGNMPLGAELAALWSMTLATGDESWFHGALAGKVLIGLFTVSVAVALGSVATREAGPRAGAFASVLFLSTPWILHTTMAGLVDGVLAGYTLFAFHAWHRARAALSKPISSSTVSSLVSSTVSSLAASPASSPASSTTSSLVSSPTFCSTSSLGWLTLAGWMAGAAAATKYTGVVFALLPIAVAIVVEPWLAGWRTRRAAALNEPVHRDRHRGDPPRVPFFRRRSMGAPLTVFLAAALVSGGGWYGKNWLTAGNPVYPLLAGVAGPGLETAEQRARWSQAHRPGGGGGAAGRSAFGFRELLGAAAQVGWRSPWQNPLLPPLALLAVMFLKPRLELLRWLAPALGILLVWWGATHRIDRFWIPALPFAALLASRGVEVLDVLYSRRWVDGALAVVFAWLLLIGASPGTPDEPFANNRFFVSLARSREAQTHPAHHWLNGSVPANGKVLLVGDARPFYLRPPTVYNTCFDRDAFSRLLADPSATARRAAFRAAGITHVFIDWSELARYRSPGNYGHTSVATPAIVHGELVERQRLLKPITTRVGSSGSADSADSADSASIAGNVDAAEAGRAAGYAATPAAVHERENLLDAVRKAGGELFEVIWDEETLSDADGIDRADGRKDVR